MMYEDNDIDDLIKLVQSVRDESITSTPTLRRNNYHSDRIYNRSVDNIYNHSVDRMNVDHCIDYKYNHNSNMDASSQCDEQGFTIKSTSKYYNKYYPHKGFTNRLNKKNYDNSAIDSNSANLSTKRQSISPDYNIDEFFEQDKKSVNWFDDDEIPNFW